MRAGEGGGECLLLSEENGRGILGGEMVRIGDQLKGCHFPKQTGPVAAGKASPKLVANSAVPKTGKADPFLFGSFGGCKKRGPSFVGGGMLPGQGAGRRHETQKGAVANPFPELFHDFPAVPSRELFTVSEAHGS